MAGGQARVWGASAFPSGLATPSTVPRFLLPRATRPEHLQPPSSGQFTDSAPPRVRTAKAPAPPRRLALLFAVAMGTAVLRLRRPPRSKHSIPASLYWPCLLPFTLGNNHLPAFPPELDSGEKYHSRPRTDAHRMLDVRGCGLGPRPLLPASDILYF